MNSICRLIQNKHFAGLSEKPEPQTSRGAHRPTLRSPVRVHVSPCSPTDGRQEDTLPKFDKGFLSPNHLPFSPRLLSRQSPTRLFPPVLSPSPVRSPLYSPDRQNIFLGRGSFGKVTLCKYKGNSIAVKMIRSESHVAGEENLIGIHHLHLVQIYHVSRVLDGTIVMMEFAGHCNLQQVLDTKSELDFRRRLSFCIQIVTGLCHCHCNHIVHGDVKPANVIVSPQGVCKLGDFGHSSRTREEETDFYNRPSKDIVGTAAYAAPEVLRGSCPGQSSDVYSFGVLLWQVHTREIPFSGEHPHVVIYKVVNYGTRPKFQDCLLPVLSRFARVAEDCWRELPSQRIDTSQALSALRVIMQSIKDGN